MTELMIVIVGITFIMTKWTYNKLVSEDTTRARVRTGEEILATLREMLVTRLEEDLDLTNPDDLDIYNKSRALQEYIDKTLREAEHDQEARKKTIL